MFSVRFSLAIGLIICCSFGLYSQTLFFDFVHYDDNLYILEDAAIHHISLETLYTILLSTENSYWGPVVRFSYMIDYALWGENAFGFHLSNQLLHIANATILLFFLNWLLSHFFTTIDKKNQLVMALLTALIVTIHPQNVETVAWIAARKDLLSVFFLLLTIFSYCIYTQRQHHKTAWFIISIICYSFAIAAKPSSLSLPFILILLDVYLLRTALFTTENFKQHKTKLLKVLVLEKLPFLALAFLTAFLTLHAHLQGGNVADLAEMPFIFRLLNAATIILVYLLHCILPVGLSAYYEFPSTSDLSYLPLISLLLLSILLFLKRGRIRFIWLAWLIFIIALFPTLGIISFNQVTAGADRFTYFPSIVIYSLMGVGFVQFHAYLLQADKHIARYGLILGSVCFFAVLLGINLQQQATWKNPLTLREHIVLTNPQSYIAHHNLGVAYFKAGNIASAIKHLNHSIELASGCLKCYDSLGRLFLAIDNKTAALIQFQKFAQKAQNSCLHNAEQVYYGLASLYFEQDELGLSQQFLTQSLQCNERYEPAKQLQLLLHQQPSS